MHLAGGRGHTFNPSATPRRADLVVEWPDGRLETIEGRIHHVAARLEDAPPAPPGIARIRARVLLPATAPPAKLTGAWHQAGHERTTA